MSAIAATARRGPGPFSAILLFGFLALGALISAFATVLGNGNPVVALVVPLGLGAAVAMFKLPMKYSARPSSFTGLSSSRANAVVSAMKARGSSFGSLSISTICGRNAVSFSSETHFTAMNRTSGSESLRKNSREAMRSLGSWL